MEQQFIKAEIGLTYYAINRDDRYSNLETHRFLWLKLQGIVKSDSGYLVIFTQGNNIGDYFSFNVGREPVAYRCKNIVNYTFRIKDLESLPNTFFIKDTNSTYWTDTSMLKSELSQLISRQLTSDKDRVNDLLKQIKHSEKLIKELSNENNNS